MTELTNEIFQLSIDSKKGKFSILTKDDKYPQINNAGLSINYKMDGKLCDSLSAGWKNCSESPVESCDLDFGSTKTVKIEIPGDENGVSYTLTFGIVEDYPLVVWKMSVHNQGKSSIEVQKINLLKIDAAPDSSVQFVEKRSPSQLGFYFNGWQSWSPTGWVAGNGRMPITHLRGLQEPMIYNAGTPKQKENGKFSSDFFAVIGDRAARTGFVLGFLSQKQHFGSIYADFNEVIGLDMWANGDGARLDTGKEMTTDWAVFNPIDLDHRDPMNKYFEAVARENQIKLPSESPTGWCSWYHFYTKISEPIIEDNLKAILNQQESMPLQLVQIDDGFESQIGDWFTFKPEFPNGVAPLAKQISEEGLIPGLWLAPFILHPKAEIIKQHPEWVLRKANGKPVNAGYVWGALTTALDLTVPEALDYACRVVKTASQEWKFPYLKLDFLYAAALPGKYHDATMTRAQVLRMGMEAIRKVVGPEVTLLGCGAPLGPMLGLVEAMRIGADVSGDWLPVFNGIGLFIKNEPSFPCARNSIRNILTRANQHKHWWINDPDCLLIRPDTHLSLGEVQTLASAIALTGGSLLVSDDLPKLQPDRLRIAENLLPVLGERARVVDWFDAEMPSKLRLDLVNETGEWHILTKFNWANQKTDLEVSTEEYGLPEGEYFYREYWNGQAGVCSDFIKIEEVSSNGCIVIALRRKDKDEPVYLGSDLHISQGVEIVDWKANQKKIDAKIRLPRKTTGNILVHIPGGISKALVSDREVKVRAMENDIFSIPVSVDGFAEIEIIRN